MSEITRPSMNSNLVNQRQRTAVGRSTEYYSTANRWFSRRFGESGLTSVEFAEENNPTSHTDEQFSITPRPTAVRFFDASDVPTTRNNTKNKENNTLKEGFSQQGSLSDIPRAKAVLIHKVKPSDTFAGLSLKYGIEVGILRRVNKLWSGDPLQLRNELRIPISHCTITNAEIENLNAQIVSQEEIEGSETRKNVENRLEIDSDSPRSSLSWSSSSSVLEDSREILEPLASLVSRAVDSISRPLKYSHAWNVVNNATYTLRRSKRDSLIPGREEGPWIQMTPTDKLHNS